MQVYLKQTHIYTHIYIYTKFPVYHNPKYINIARIVLNTYCNTILRKCRYRRYLGCRYTGSTLYTISCDS